VLTPQKLLIRASNIRKTIFLNQCNKDWLNSGRLPDMGGSKDLCNNTIILKRISSESPYS